MSSACVAACAASATSTTSCKHGPREASEPDCGGGRAAGLAQDDPLWYKDAVIYQAHVRAFYDSNNDGIGDFPGITQKLDYIQDLGVNTIWLLPFYPSPGRDDGYDIADYHNVHPQYGTRHDFRIFVREAHRRGLKVITELVINHTSDQHPWFQAARRAPRGSSKRDFYVWSDDPTRYARHAHHLHRHGSLQLDLGRRRPRPTIWHRFFSHQPDLNFANPSVLKALTKAMRFWLDMGVDGLRLDAIPYLCEREGTNNENLPETHAVIKQIRRVIDRALPQPHAARGGQPMAGGRARLLRGRRRMPDGVPLSADAAHVHGHRAAGPPPDRRDHAADAGHPGQLPVGDLPAQPRRAHAGDGHQQGARLHVHHVRRRSARAHQPRHPAAARAA